MNMPYNFMFMHSLSYSTVFWGRSYPAGHLPMEAQNKPTIMLNSCCLCLNGITRNTQDLSVMISCGGWTKILCNCARIKLHCKPADDRVPVPSLPRAKLWSLSLKSIGTREHFVLVHVLPATSPICYSSDTQWNICPLFSCDKWKLVLTHIYSAL